MSHQTEEAWKYFSMANLSKAEQLSIHLVNSRKARVTETPLLKIWLVQANILIARDKKADAVDLLTKIIHVDPGDIFARSLMLTLLKDHVGNKENANGQLILGIGTGRNGSTSLTGLFASQKATYCTHEFPPLLPWNNDPDDDLFLFHLERFKLLAQTNQYVCEVSHWWLPRIELLLHNGLKLKVVAIKRAREETIRSFLNIKGGGDRGSINHWVDHDGKYWSANPWDVCYPKYAVDSTKEALYEYWDEYYASVERIEKSYPDVIKTFSIEALSGEEGQETILRFCGFKPPFRLGDFHKNKNTVVDGFALFQNPLS